MITSTKSISESYKELLHINHESLKVYITSPVIKEIGQVLMDYSLHLKYCMHLLHTHYKLENNEVIFKKVYPNKIVTNVILDSDVPQPIEEIIISPTIFKLGKDTIYPLEIGFLPKSFKIEDSDVVAFNKIVKILEKHDLSNIFGFGFRHALYEVVNNKKTFLEATFSDRSQTMTLVDEELAYSDKYKAIPTCWIFNPADNGSVVAACPYTCASDPEGEHGHGSEHTGESV